MRAHKGTPGNKFPAGTCHSEINDRLKLTMPLKQQIFVCESLQPLKSVDI